MGGARNALSGKKQKPGIFPRPYSLKGLPVLTYYIFAPLPDLCPMGGKGQEKQIFKEPSRLQIIVLDITGQNTIYQSARYETGGGCPKKGYPHF